MERAQAGDRPRDSVIEFFCSSCGRKIRVAKVKAGQKGKCPGCGGVVRAPSPEVEKSVKDTGNLDASVFDTSEVEELRLKREKQLSDKSYEKNEVADEIGENDERKLPWFIDVVFYPTNPWGLTSLGIFVFGSAMVGFMGFLLGRLLHSLDLGEFARVIAWPMAIVLAILRGIFYAYIFWYFGLCIRDSAAGGVRAPSVLTLSGGDDLSDMAMEMLRLACGIIICIGPALAYNRVTERTDIYFWLIQSIGVFFLPMAVLAVVMFGSLEGLNPVLIISSMFRSFIEYLGAVAAFYVPLAIVGFFGLARIFGASVLSALVTKLVVVYLLLVAAHILGRFYWRNQEKLNWEV